MPSSGTTAPRVLEKPDTRGHRGCMPFGTERPIRPDETSGVLHPDNLTRYDARWIDPDPAVRDVVDQYWHVRWRLDPGETIAQTIVDLPAVTLTIEAGDVPSALVVTGL